MAPNAISTHKLYTYDSYTYYPVVIVGAGESGIAMGCQLKEQLGFDQFRIFDRQGGIGGTWWINRYPGVACDVPAMFYSFSFSPNDKWTTFHPPGPEIVQYLGDVCTKYQIADKIQLNTNVAEARWLEEEEQWELTLEHMRAYTGDLSAADRQKLIAERGDDYVYVGKETIRAKVLATAVGALVEPQAWPKHVTGLEQFEGAIIHSARWDATVDMEGKDVVVVGTGCSAAQLVPRLVQAPYRAKSVTQIMRSAPWVVPAPEPPGMSVATWERWSPQFLGTVPGLALLIRTLIFCASEWDFRLFHDGEWNRKERRKYEAGLLDHMQRTAPEKYHELLTPNYPVCCKRRIFDRFWLPSLHDPKIELTNRPLTKVQPRGVTLGPLPKSTGSTEAAAPQQLPADVIVVANGFATGEWLLPLTVRGQGGKDLHGVWKERGGAQAYLGTAMDGFPNMFMIFGPNTVTGHSSVILASENMVALTLRLIRPILAGDASQVAVKEEAELAYTHGVQERLKTMVFKTGACHNWYTTADGWNSLTYPYTQVYFYWICRFVQWRDWNVKYTRRGLWRLRGKQMLSVAAWALLITGVLQARGAGYGWKALPRAARDAGSMIIRTAVELGRQGLGAAQSYL
ncbi:MAG: hypothetical protein M1838_003615 [Thelocarpon superellum]|nr:MAG: hypothetical protein M1838_003615 [Thelocarpon superellum]